MSEAVERIRALRRELDEQQSAIEAKRNEKIFRISLLCGTGFVPESESFERFKDQIDDAAAKGEQRLRNGISGFLRPSHDARNKSASARVHSGAPSLATLFGDVPEVLAYLLHDELIEAGRAMIHEAVQEAERSDRLVPDHESRISEIDTLDDEIDQLTEDAEAIRSELHSIGRGQAKPNTGRSRVYSPDDDD